MPRSNAASLLVRSALGSAPGGMNWRSLWSMLRSEATAGEAAVESPSRHISSEQLKSGIRRRPQEHDATPSEIRASEISEWLYKRGADGHAFRAEVKAL